MGKHKEWRKIVKKDRRKRIRTQQAIARDYQIFGNNYGFLNEQEIWEFQEIENQNEIENQKWLEAERIAQEQWTKIQMKREVLHKKQLEQWAKLKLEREMEKQKREKEKERLRKIEEENKIRQETFEANLERYLTGDTSELPAELAVLYETRPTCSVCPFFMKTGCCRFGDECSRNHKYPGISKILLIPSMFAHFGLENANFNEYDTDIMLEYEDSDTYKDFKSFFYDILPEFQKYGKVVELKVCHNLEKHLRGNTYVEYTDIPSAVVAYRALHARWYGGKQLSLQFCNITSWNSAVCGLQSSRCPKGRACNYLHIFNNPIKIYHEDKQFHRQEQRSSRSWRWSESPERTSPKRTSREHMDRDRRQYENHSHRSRTYQKRY